MNKVKEAVARFPKYFGLRAFPDKLFCIGERESFIDDSDNVKLYTKCLIDMPFQWLDFAKGTEEELASQIAPIPERYRKQWEKENN